MLRTLVLIGLMLGAMAAAKARAEGCPGNPDALGTSRVMTVDPREFPRIGTVQYSRSLPLADKEVVLTFDDGPLPPYTNRILDTLAEHCVRANYFIIGRMARGYPDLLRKVQAAGHVIGNHSQNHPLAFERMPIPDVQDEIERGFASLHSVLGANAVAPFFRIPGLLRAPQVEGYLQTRQLVTWSADVVADDWKHISAAEVVRRAISRLDEKGKGILLLHDIQPATALALPELLRELKAKNYRVVLVVPGKDGVPAIASAAPAVPATAPAPVPAPLTPIVPPRPPVAHAAAEPAAMAPSAVHAAAEPTPAARPVRAMPTAASESYARGPAVPRDPVKPITSAFKPPLNMSMPGKFITTDPGGWPPVVSVPIPAAGGVGVSPLPPPASQSADGRFVLR